MLLVGAVDDGAGDRMPEQVEAQVGRRRVLRQLQLRHADRVHRDVVPVRAVSGGGAAPMYRLRLASLAKVMASPGNPLPSPTPAGNCVTVAGRFATAQCQKPDAVGASGS